MDIDEETAKRIFYRVFNATDGKGYIWKRRRKIPFAAMIKRLEDPDMLEAEKALEEWINDTDNFP